MKTLTLFLLIFACAAGAIHAQGTFVYDQQSSTIEVYPPYISTEFQPYQPFGQSFTPTLSSIGFIRLYISDRTFPTGAGATIYVNLREDSITGSVLGFTSPVLMPGGFFGYTNFFFSTPVGLTPGTAYFLQPVAEAGNPRTQLFPSYSYAAGTAFINGVASPYDLWFREGIIVTEPSVAFLSVAGVAVAGWFRRNRFAAR